MGFAAADTGQVSDARPAIADRLTDEFAVLPAATVRRQVDNAWACALQLGLEITPWLVERVAREHLTHLVRSTPPSGRDTRVMY